MACVVVNYWETDNTSPVLDFIQGEPKEAGAKIQKVIDLFEQNGFSLLNSPYLKKMQGYQELFELRIQWKGFAYRVLMVVRQAAAWLVHAFRKTTQKTPLPDIRLALQRQALIPNFALAN